MSRLFCCFTQNIDIKRHSPGPPGPCPETVFPVCSVDSACRLPLSLFFFCGFVAFVNFVRSRVFLTVSSIPHVPFDFSQHFPPLTVCSFHLPASDHLSHISLISHIVPSLSLPSSCCLFLSAPAPPFSFVFNSYPGQFPLAMSPVPIPRPSTAIHRQTNLYPLPPLDVVTILSNLTQTATTQAFPFLLF